MKKTCLGLERRGEKGGWKRPRHDLLYGGLYKASRLVDELDREDTWGTKGSELALKFGAKTANLQASRKKCFYTRGLRTIPGKR